MKQGKKKKVLALGSICLMAGIASAVLMGMASGDTDRPDAAETPHYTIVDTQNARIGSIVSTGSYVGTVEPGQQVYVYPKAYGTVTTANFAVGDYVEAGEILLQIDSTEAQLRVAQQQAAINAQQAAANLTLEQVQNNIDTYNSNIGGGYNEVLVAAENDVQTAEVALQAANADLTAARRNRRTLRDNYADDFEMDAARDQQVQAEVAVEAAQLQLEQAQQALELARKQVTDAVDDSDFSLRQAELGTNLTYEHLALQELQKALNDHTITAPISGIVEQKNLKIHDLASAEVVAYVISNKDAVIVSFYVAESALAHVQPGDIVLIEKDDVTHPGTVSEISTMVDDQTGLYKVKAMVENAPFDLRSGSTIKIYADTQKVENELLLPIDAVYYDNGTPYVYLFRDNTARRVEITVGITDDAFIHVKSGLTITDQVIVTWTNNLFDGADVYLPDTIPQPQEMEQSEETEAEPDVDDTADSDEAQDDSELSGADMEESEGGESSPLHDGEEDAA